MKNHLPEKQGLYRPGMEKDNCGVGAVASLANARSREVVEKALEILKNLSHRGAMGLDESSGDGSGIMTDIPHGFYDGLFNAEGLDLPDAGGYAVGMLFLPREPAARLFCEGVVERIAREEGFKVLFWRDVPQNKSFCGKLARAARPDIAQIFLAPLRKGASEKELFLLRKRVQSFIAESKVRYTEKFYVCSLSFRTIVYKGLVPGAVLGEFYADLGDERYKSRVAMVHERYSTNTFPSWELAQPFRLLAHNGEINTVSGNVNWMRAREGVMTSDVFGARLKDAMPVVEPGGSDSASFDNVLEFLVSNGHGQDKVLSMMIPKSWEENSGVDRKGRAFYAYHSRFMEPWDGPASIISYDGKKLCAVRDKNGLRPIRYDIDRRGLLVMASESGVIEGRGELDAKGGIKPGDVICFDLENGLFFDGDATLEKMAGEHDYGKWLQENRIGMESLRKSCDEAVLSDPEKKKMLALFGYRKSELTEGCASMADFGKEATVSMGIDRALPALSEQNHLLFDYFKHRFAQVTNPPMDPIREKMFTSLRQIIGFPGNRVDRVETDSEMPFIEIESPLLDNEEMAGLKQLGDKNFRSVTVPMLFPSEGDGDRLEKAVEELLRSCESCVRKGYNILILSDRQANIFNAPIPCLLAVSAVHQHLVATRMRTRVEILVETAEVRDVSQTALLLGYGAKAVNPWLAIEWIRERAEEKDGQASEAVANFKKAMASGILKIIAKMGITTLQAYQGAKLFETVGLSEEFIEKYFRGTPSSLGGVDLATILKEAEDRHSNAYSSGADNVVGLMPKEKPALFGRLNVERVRAAAERDDYGLYKSVSDEIKDSVWSIRSLLEIKPNENAGKACMETEESVIRRFSASAMSYGAISPESHVAISKAMNRLGAISNSGEGGEKDDMRAESERSGGRQIASGRFGVDVAYLADCREIEIKVAQGAKPGEGGHLPPEKVTVEIAKVRNASPGISLISPPPHHDIYSIEDLAQLIHDLRQVNPKASISVKLVASSGIGTVAAGVAKAGADRILVSGGNGGTGAAPLSSTRSAGIPWEIGLAEVHQTLLLNDLRHCVELRVDGKLLTGHDVVKAAMLGAESFGFATALLIAMGCRMCRKCQKNICPAGIATQDEELRRRFKGKSEHVERYMRFVARDTIEILGKFGFESLEEVIGRSDLLVKRGKLSKKAERLELESVLFRPELPSRIADRYKPGAKASSASTFDLEIAEEAMEALKEGVSYEAERKITNRDRGVGIYLSGLIAREGLKDKVKDGSVRLKLYGSAGQSLGGFLTKGVSLRVCGDVNDYAGKSLSGGKIVVVPNLSLQGKIRSNVIAGNTVLYGASGGIFYGAGVAGDRFAVRNSGAVAVCEGIGNNGCEYMTGGTVVVLGSTGVNFAAGMSGGKAFVLDEKTPSGKGRRIGDNIEGRSLGESDKKELVEILRDYEAETGSPVAGEIIGAWPGSSERFSVFSPEKQ